MRQGLVRLLLGFCRWLDDNTFLTMTGQVHHQAIAADLDRLRQIRHWLVDVPPAPPMTPRPDQTPPLEPLQHPGYQDLNSLLATVREQLQDGQWATTHLAEINQSLSRHTLAFLEDLECIARRDLRVKLSHEICLGELGAIADCLNLLIENLRTDLQTLPLDHPLRQKYKL